jgi:short-subunit dehydrogenase
MVVPKMDLKGKVAIVTGASSGIGLATARLLSSKGAKLALVARSKGKLEKLAAELPDSIAVPADMTKINEIENMTNRTLQHFGKIDILINNAGQGYDAAIEKIDPDVFHCIFNLDVLGPVVAMQQVIPAMRRQRGGAIVNVSSGLAFIYLPSMSAYGSLKRALSHISLTAREELKDDKITVSVMYPYITATDFEKNTIKAVPEEQNWEPEGEGGGAPFPPDTPEYVAQKIVDAIETGDAEVFAHDWMKNPRKR